MLRRLLLPLLLLLAPAAARADVLGGANHITPALVAESATPAAGKPLLLAFAMTPQPTWHGYWANPGDAGMDTLVKWTAPAGLRFGPLRYPVPGTLLIAGLMNYVYEGPHALLVEVQVPAGLSPGTRLPISAKLDWLACNPATCVPETANLATTLTIGDGAVTPADRARFDRWQAALPRPLGVTAHFQRTGEVVRIAVPLPAAAATPAPYFFPLTPHAIDYAAPQKVTRAGDLLTIETRVARDAAALPRLDGVLRLGENSGVALAAAPGAVVAGSATTAPEAAPAAGGMAALLFALGGAVLGGLLLNVMPCVFPILSLKALSLARAGGGGEAEARREALAYTAGVVLVCAGLGAALLGLRAAGSAAGWAFQLQDPRVIAMLLLLVLGIGLNLAGLFELPVIAAGGSLAAKGGAGGAFWTGALAAFVATPCAGPFLGTALGAAVLLPAAGALAIFVGLGLGLALPFLLLGFVPALRRRLPRPGAWMDTLRRLLAVPMLVTALGLAWVLGRQAAADGMATGLAAALLLALGLWWAGRRQAEGRTQAWLPGAIAAAGALVICAAVPQAPPAAAATVAGADGHEPFSEARLAALRAEGRPVFLYFTADWCLTCKVNEAAAIDRGEVRRAFTAAHVATVTGDWTRGDPAITRFLAAHGRSGVPFYLWYPAKGGAPRELPQVLTPGLLADLA